MALDPQVRALLDQLVGRPALNTLPVDVGRRAYVESSLRMVPQPAAPVEVADRAIDGPAGPVPVRDIVLVESTRLRDAARYDVLARYPLR